MMKHVATTAFLLLLAAAWGVAEPDAPAPYGDGHFGRWTADDEGLPAYVYEMDQAADPRAAYTVTGGQSRDHWHLLGNDRIVATAHNGGYVQLYDWSRGGKVVNRWEPERGEYAGGFKFVRTAGATISTLWERLPENAEQARIFGAGYFEKRTRYAGWTIVERIEAPRGDDPVLLSTTTVENGTGAAGEIDVVEFWDANLHQLTPAPMMTHQLDTVFTWFRRGLNRHFVMNALWQEETAILSIDSAYAGGPPPVDRNASAYVDFYPANVFLAALDPVEPGFPAYTADGDRFFSETGLDDPPGVLGAADGALFSERSMLGGHAVLAIRRHFTLEAGARAETRYLYGYAGKDAVPDLVQRYRTPEPKPPLAVLEWTAPEAPWLTRELLWHSYYLQAGLLYQESRKAHFIDQGSAYGYLQGLSGAPRDFALFILPMIYLRPAMANEMIRFLFALQDPAEGFPYALTGVNQADGFVVHGRSSDLDLFCLWALSEYLGATQDRNILDASVPFQTKETQGEAPLIEHARMAFRHLAESVGLGPHGLIRCGTGDWNDVLIAFSDQPLATLAQGESALNAALAVVALPALADGIEDRDPAFGASLRAFADSQKQALQSLWTGEWMARGYLGHDDATLGADRLFLDAQGFAVLGNVWTPEQTRLLFDRIQSDCAAPQRAGARALWPAMEGPFLEAGSDTNGGTWAAVDAWTAWGWSKHDPRAAWDFFLGTTLAAHAEAYPDIWYGVWSGPDSYNADYHPRPGETFNVNFTPMTDFPIMNMNRHAGPLLDAIKLAGLGHRDGRIAIDPRLPFDTFDIRLPLIGAAYKPGEHRGYYTPATPGKFRFAVRPPAGVPPDRARLTVNGRKAKFTASEDGTILFDSEGTPDARIEWEIR